MTRWCDGPCGRELPETDAYFAPTKNGWNGRLARRKTCRACFRIKVREGLRTARAKKIRKASSRRHYLRRREHILERSRRYWHQVRGPRLSAARAA